MGEWGNGRIGKWAIRNPQSAIRNPQSAICNLQMIYDISLPISNDLPVWPGDSTVRIVRDDSLPAVSEITLGSHTGTHVDAPAHFFKDGATVDQLPLDALVGPAWVAYVPGPGPITAGQLAAADIPDGPIRLLLRTDNSGRIALVWAFETDFVALAPDAADWLLARGIRLVGIDAPSVELAIERDGPVHRALLGAGVVIVENLDLTDIAPGGYRLACLPLRIMGGDGAPARAVLIRET
jgi:arylformamidase